MRSLERRVNVLEDDGVDGAAMRFLLDRLSVPDLERLEQLIIASTAGDWCMVTALTDHDRRILAEIGIDGDPE